MEISNLGRLILDAKERKAEREGRKRYSLHNLANDAGTVQPYLTRVVHGNGNPSKNMLIKLCKALGCTTQERADIFHAAGYLSPEELEEESAA